MRTYWLHNLPLWPRSYGKPTNVQPWIPEKSIEMFDGAFVKAGTFVEETKDKDILSWFYKDENETIATTTKVNIPIEQYCNGYKIMQNMGYEGKGPIVKWNECISEPIYPHTQYKEDKSRLGYPKLKKKQHNYQHPRWRNKTAPKEEPWQERLNQVAKIVADKQ